jgi:hypothetical protein
MDQSALLEQMLAADAKRREEAAAERERQLLLQLENRPSIVDTTPLAALSDSLFGSKIAQGAQAVQQAAKADEDILNQLLAEQRREPKGSGINPSSMLSNKDKQNDIQERFDTSQVNNAFKSITDDFGKERKAVDELDTQLTGIEKALKSRNYERIKGQLSNFARAVNSEKGVLTDSDLGRTFVDTLDTIFIRFASKFDKSGKLREEDLINLKDAIEEAKRTSGSVISERLEAKRQSYKGNPTYSAAMSQHESAKDGGVVGSIYKKTSNWKDYKIDDTEENKGASMPSVDALKAELAKRKK